MTNVYIVSIAAVDLSVFRAVLSLHAEGVFVGGGVINCWVRGQMRLVGDG